MSRRDVSFPKHGQKLNTSLQIRSDSIDKVSEDDSLSDTSLMIFKVEINGWVIPVIKDKYCEHIRNTYSEGELDSHLTCREFRQVQKEFL